MTADAPICPYCNIPAIKTDGRTIYPHRPDLAAKVFWRCERCNSYCGCHGSTDRPLGVPANAATRKARMILHDQMIDPLWMEADRVGLYTPENEKARKIIRNAARGRVYAYLAHHLGIDCKDCHTGLFDIETCRRAWKALNGVKYSEIRAWAKARKAAA